MKKLGLVVLMLLTMASFVFAQADIGLKSIGGKVGFVMPEDPIESTIGLGVVADLGTITDAIHLDAFVEYWGKSYDVGLFEWSYTNITIGATAKYYFEMDSEFKPYAGGGLGFVIGSSSADYSGPNSEYFTDTSDSNTDIGFHFVGGADYELSDTMTGFAEVKYSLNGVDTFAIFAGVRFAMGQ
jgi:hypothetical protein